ncbi:MAG: response regulator transcription factor [Sedimentisphaerales bacterium]|jgi:DNA-binding NarL/FixJ family response regulator
MKVLIVDDHGIVREGLKALIKKRADVEVVGEAEDGNAAVKLVSRFAPDVVIMDVTMPNLNGVEATRTITRNNPNTKVIALSMHTDKTIVREMFKAGAYGYVLKSYLFDELNKSLEALKKGERYLSPHIAVLIRQDYAASKAKGTAGNRKPLSERERQVLQLVAEGKSIKEISLLLHLSPKTTDAHRRNLMTKLGTASVADLIKYAIREGLTSLDF